MRGGVAINEVIQAGAKDEGCAVGNPMGSGPCTQLVAEIRQGAIRHTLEEGLAVRPEEVQEGFVKGDGWWGILRGRGIRGADELGRMIAKKDNVGCERK